MRYSYYFINTLDYRMDLLIREAYSSSSYFAEETNHVSYLGEVYDLHGLVQCTPDLDQYDCYRCLKWAYNETEDCCYGKSFSLVYTTKCILTHRASFPSPAPPPPPPPPPPSLCPSSGNNSPDSFSFKFKGKVFRRIICPVIAAVVMILVICVCYLCCCCCKKKKDEVQEREMSTTNVIVSPTVDQPIAKTESQLPN